MERTIELNSMCRIINGEVDCSPLLQKLSINTYLYEDMSFEERTYRFMREISDMMDIMYNSQCKIDNTILFSNGKAFNLPYRVMVGEVPEKKMAFYRNSRRVRAWCKPTDNCASGEYYVHLIIYTDQTAYVCYLTKEQDSRYSNRY